MRTCARLHRYLLTHTHTHTHTHSHTHTHTHTLTHTYMLTQNPGLQGTAILRRALDVGGFTAYLYRAGDQMISWPMTAVEVFSL